MLIEYIEKKICSKKFIDIYLHVGLKKMQNLIIFMS